jgi:glycosyltransferase involved in cell wall biosynthesis
MSYGTPVIASAVGGTGEWLEDGLTGFAVPPNDPAALAQAIDRLIGDEALAARMSETARRRYHERFRPEHHIEALIKLYDTLVEESSRS